MLQLDFSSHTQASLINRAKELSSSAQKIEQQTGAFLLEWLNEGPYIVAHTSGSTGEPKHIEILKYLVENSARMTGSFFKLKSGQTALLCLSPEFIAGKMMMIRALIHKMKLIIVEPSSDPLSGLTAKIDLVAMVPSQVVEILRKPNGFRELDQVKNLLIGGGPIPPILEEKLQHTSAHAFGTYGMTETISHIALRRVNGVQRTDRFTPFSGIDVSLDSRSCLVINAPAISKDTVVTNDIADLSKVGSFRILGRYDNIVISGGIKINPEEIEALLAPGIDVPFFVGSLTDEKFGEILVMVIESIAKPRKLDHLLQQIPSIKRPKEVFYLKQFIRTETGKVKRKETLALLA